MKWQRCVSGIAALVLAATASVARADVFNMGPGLTSLDFVAVGNPGNAGELSGTGAGVGGGGTDAIVGGVGYLYAIGKYEVTAGQYTAFLNAVAATDTYELYNTDMMKITVPWSGCKIERSGSSGSYTYSVAADRANRPVNFVSWGDAARFMNWLHNGQPTGAQSSATTEDGAYTLDGRTDHNLLDVIRNTDAKYWIPTENEWYKAAYHKNDGVTANYFDYPTSSDSIPSNDLISPDPGNRANCVQNNKTTIGSPYWTTEVGAFENSESPYGTFDQGGNVWEWNETVVQTDQSRGYRGGAWDTMYYRLLASYRNGGHPTYEDYHLGFRVATVPEPGGIILMACGAVAGLLWWRWRLPSPSSAEPYCWVSAGKRSGMPTR